MCWREREREEKNLRYEDIHRLLEKNKIKEKEREKEIIYVKLSCIYSSKF